jgi:uncharacterized Zn-binding protein involved in type VI secretion
MPMIGRAFTDRAGGQVTTGSPTVSANDLPVAMVGSLVQAHSIFHNNVTMAAGFPSVTVGDIPVCVMGSVASCGHALITTCTNVEVG